MRTPRGKAAGLQAFSRKVLDVVKPEPTEAIPLPGDDFGILQGGGSKRGI